MKKYLLILVAMVLTLQMNAKFYVLIGKIHKIEGEPCYSVELLVYDNNNNNDPHDDRLVGKFYERICPGKINDDEDIIGEDANSLIENIYRPVDIEGEPYTPVTIKVSPNPAHSRLLIDFNGNEFRHLSIQPINNIKSFSENDYMTFPEKVYKGTMSIDISKLNPGIYSITAVSDTNNKIAFIKFIKN